uniref:SCP domain-containing protein n=1 Tax=Ascaris lumbricoides TaxID=6252 RepID=A0A0M3I4Y2_ASCLU
MLMHRNAFSRVPMRHDGRRVDGLAGKHVLHHAPQLCTERTLLLSACKKHGERCSARAVNVAASGKTPPRFNVYLLVR